jgi:hypothetical protein
MMMPAQVTSFPRYIMFFLFGNWTGIQFLNTYPAAMASAWFGGSAFFYLSSCASFYRPSHKRL